MRYGYGSVAHVEGDGRIWVNNGCEGLAPVHLGVLDLGSPEGWQELARVRLLAHGLKLTSRWEPLPDIEYTDVACVEMLPGDTMAELARKFGVR